MLNVVDEYCWTEHRKLLTPKETGIAALPCFGLNFRQQAAQPLMQHIHQGCMEIVFLINGFQIYEASNASYNLSGSDIFVSYVDEPHSSDGQLESVCDMIWLQIDMTPGLPFFGLSDSRADQLRAALRTLPRVFSGDDSLRHMLTDAFYALASADAFDRFCGEQLLVCALQRMKRASDQMTPRHANRIGDAIVYIRDHICDPLPLGDVAAVCGLSLSRFKTCFRAETGVTPREYINQLKIRHAMQLLSEGVSVTDTAMALGFTTPNYFSVLFHKYTCQTPSQYAKAAAK